MYGGEGGIRTHAALTRPNAFRVRPLQPGLGTSPKHLMMLRKAPRIYYVNILS